MQAIETKKERQSNIELLRIISIFLILVTHADFWALGEPTVIEVSNSFLSSFTRIFFESLSIICINIFVLISGWFSIRTSLKSIIKLLFQVYFMLLVIYLIYIILGGDTINVRSLSQCFIVGHEFWFVKAYLGLLILSPVLNAFVNSVSERILRIVLVAFFIYQFVYAWITPGAWFLHYGYSVTSFAGLYLLARYVRLYIIENYSDNTKKWGGHFIMSKPFYLLVFIGLTLLNAVFYVLGYYLPVVGIHLRTMTFAISSPIVIIQSLSLLLFFNNSDIKYNPVINFIAASSFSVYILQSSQDAVLYQKVISDVYNNFNGLCCLSVIILVIIGYFIVGILLDQVRKLVWNRIELRIPDMKFFE